MTIFCEVIMDDCIFCRIIKKEIPSQIVYEDAEVIAIKDIHPQAPVHVLVMPKTHIPDIIAFSETDDKLQSAVNKAVIKTARICGVADEGFRVINNCKESAGQTVWHVHFHVIGGKILGEKII